MKTTMLIVGCALCAPLTLAASLAAAQDRFGFTGVTRTDTENTAAGQRQLRLELLESGPRLALTNLGPDPLVVTDVYFDISRRGNGTPEYAFSAVGGDGLCFVGGSGPLAGGAGLTRPFESVQSITAAGGDAACGVGAGETLLIDINRVLGNGNIAEGVPLGALRSDLDHGRLRIAVEALFPDGGTETFIITPCPADVDDGRGGGRPDGGVTVDDLTFYLGLYNAGNILADVDDGTGTGTPDRGVTIDDLLFFLARFDAGC